MILIGFFLLSVFIYDIINTLQKDVLNEYQIFNGIRYYFTLVIFIAGVFIFMKDSQGKMIVNHGVAILENRCH